MKVNIKELKRIAKICHLEFSDDELNCVKQSFNNPLEETQLIYQAPDFDDERNTQELLTSETLIR